jgi:hypothetical protein
MTTQAQAWVFRAAIAVAAAATTCTAIAGATPDEIARLGRDLTPVGAERAANKDGSIPAWDGGLKGLAGMDLSKGYPDPHQADKPLYTITAANAAQYADKLSPGQLELLKRQPGYKITVYPTRRSAAYPQSVYDAIKAEAGKAETTGGGNGITGVVRTTVPFPVPKTGIEVLWNHMNRYRGGTLTRYQTQFPVHLNGSFTPVTRVETIAWANALPNPDPNRLLYYITTLTGPSSMAGESNLLHSYLDQVKEPNQVWAYNPGQRRVLRAPDLSHDAPQIGADGLATIDDYDGFFAPTDRFNWKLVGKREMIISYNNFKLNDKALKYSDIVRPAHMNQDLVRYELHRVWVVEATVKQGARHVYAKRMFYFDEDSWQMAHADQFDGRGELWRVHELHAVPYYDVPLMLTACDVIYDLQARRYIVFGLSNQEKPIRFGVKVNTSDFTVDALRRGGH